MHTGKFFYINLHAHGLFGDYHSSGCPDDVGGTGHASCIGMTYQKMLELLSVFKNPSTRIGGENTTVVHRNEGASRVRSRTGSGSDDDRRVLIPDVETMEIWRMKQGS